MPYVPNKYPFQGELLTLAEISARVGKLHKTLYNKMRDYDPTVDQTVSPTPVEPDPSSQDGTEAEAERWTLERMDLAACIYEYPEGMPLEMIADVWGVSRQRVHQIESAALAKLRTSGVSIYDLREYLNAAYQRAPHPWQGAWDADAECGGMSKASPMLGRHIQLSAEAAEPSELTARIDAAIARLDVAADRALLAALMPVRLGES